MVALATDPFHFGDGSITRLAAWPQTVRPVPVLVMARADAVAAGLADQQRAVIEGPSGSAQVQIVTGETLRPGQGRASAAFSEVREVFDWSWEGRPPGEPVSVRFRKV
jgi:anaerobic selenocysteine-containing dehydrogenase